MGILGDECLQPFCLGIWVLYQGFRKSVTHACCLLLRCCHGDPPPQLCFVLMQIQIQLQVLFHVRDFTCQRRMIFFCGCWYHFWQLVNKTRTKTPVVAKSTRNLWYQCNSMGLVFLIVRLQSFKFSKVMKLWVAQKQEFAGFEI